MVTKGAMDVLLERSIMTPEERRKIERVNEQFPNEGLRVLAFSCHRVDSTAVSLADENGRNVYANIKRAIQFLLSGNTAGILTVLYASLLGLVQLVPALEPLFAVAPLSVGMVGAIVGLAFGSMLMIQFLKWIRRQTARQ